MKTALLCALVLLATTVSLAPAAEARNFCVGGVDPWCPGVYCKWDPGFRRWDCVIPWDPVECVQECPPERVLP